MLLVCVNHFGPHWLMHIHIHYIVQTKRRRARSNRASINKGSLRQLEHCHAPRLPHSYIVSCVSVRTHVLLMVHQQLLMD